MTRTTSSVTAAPLTPAAVTAKPSIPARSVHLTPAQAATLGITPPTRKRGTRKALPRDGAVTICKNCGEVFGTDAAETHHVNTVHGGRYECELT